MFISLAIILLITLGGTLLTYLYEKEDSLLVRFSAGNVIGSAIFSLIAFLLACFVGLSTTTILISIALTLLPLALFSQTKHRQSFVNDLQKAKGLLEGATFNKVLSFVYYLFILVILWFFFDRAMYETKDGVFTGASQNLGDLPFHLGAIFSFTEANNFPPENPSYIGAKFTYPFMADFIAACLVKFGAKVQDAMFVQNITLCFSLAILLEKFAVKLTANKLAGKLTPLLLFFCGGLGFVIFFRDYWKDGRSIFEFIWNLPPMDYTIRPEGLRWGASLVVLFTTQRGFLLGMPIVLIVLTKLWEIFATNRNTETRGQGNEMVGQGDNETGRQGDRETGRQGDRETEVFLSHRHTVTPSRRHPITPSLYIGMLAGTLPLIHVHSLFVLFIVCAFLFFLRLDKWREWIAFAIGVCLIAIPELIWNLTGSATNLSKFIGWYFGWDKGNENVFIFWAKNLGLFLPFLITAIFLIFKDRNADTENDETEPRIPHPKSLLLFYIPFLFIFILCNTVKLAPWQWDNIKVFIYWFIASVPLVAWLLVYFWEKQLFFKLIAVTCFIILTLSGALDVWKTMSKQVKTQVFNKDSVQIAEEIKQKTPPNALFLNAATYNSAVVWSGRRSLMRYTGHLSSYGIEYESREKEVLRIYEGSALSTSFLSKNNIEYVLVSPEERNYMIENKLFLNEAFFEKYLKIAEVGAYKVYKVR